MATTLADILRRFRFHVAPGAPNVVGVPVDRARAIDDELAPVFDALEDAQREADLIVASAAAEAERSRNRARDEGQARLAAAENRVAAVSAEVATATLQGADDDARRIVAEAHDRAAQIAARVDEHSPALVEQVVRRVLEMGSP